MDRPATLAEALVHRAAATPHAPWLFEPHGWDWRWRSFASAAAAVEQATRTLVAAFPSSGTRIALADHPTSETVVLDLAIQQAGLVSVPLGLLTPEALDPGESGGGGTLVEASAATPSFISAAALATAAAAFAASLGPAAERQRDVVVVTGPFLAAAERRLLAWATWTGAAVLLVPPPDRVATAAWARVTVFLGSGEEAAGLARAAGLGARRRFAARRRPRPPFGRLRAVIATPPPPAEAAAFLRDRGVALLGREALE